MSRANPQQTSKAAASVQPIAGAVVATALAALPPPFNSAVLTPCVPGYDYVTFPTFPCEKARIGRLDDEGGSDCFLVREKETGTLYTLQKLKKPKKRENQSDEEFEELIDKMKRSFDIAIQMKHPNVRAVKEVLPVQEQSDDYYYIIKQYIHGSRSVHDVIKRVTNLCESDARRLFQQAVLGLLYYHRNGIIHGEIYPNKLAVECDQITNMPRKIFISEVYFCDPRYGLNFATVGDHMSYRAPERSEVTPTYDVWSLGCVLYEMITGKRAFASGPYQILPSGECSVLKMRAHELITGALKDLLDHMFDPNPATRYRLEDVMKHTWFAAGFINPEVVEGYCISTGTVANSAAPAEKAPVTAPAASSTAVSPALFRPANSPSATGTPSATQGSAGNSSNKQFTDDIHKFLGNRDISIDELMMLINTLKINHSGLKVRDEFLTYIDKLITGVQKTNINVTDLNNLMLAVIAVSPHQTDSWRIALQESKNPDASGKVKSIKEVTEVFNRMSNNKAPTASSAPKP